ncbi:MAG: membrane protein insertion efficiency factor YidD [Syntrophales bacterium]
MYKKIISPLFGKILIGFIYLYRIGLSPLSGPCCRFHPSCSVYAMDAIHQYGPFKGSYLGLRRLLRCHPFHPGGYDPVR